MPLVAISGRYASLNWLLAETFARGAKFSGTSVAMAAQDAVTTSPAVSIRRVNPLKPFRMTLPFQCGYQDAIILQSEG
jgi:hypothetical protein